MPTKILKFLAMIWAFNMKTEKMRFLHPVWFLIFIVLLPIVMIVSMFINENIIDAIKDNYSII